MITFFYLTKEEIKNCHFKIRFISNRKNFKEEKLKNPYPETHFYEIGIFINLPLTKNTPFWLRIFHDFYLGSVRVIPFPDGDFFFEPINLKLDNRTFKLLTPYLREFFTSLPEYEKQKEYYKEFIEPYAYS